MLKITEILVHANKIQHILYKTMIVRNVRN